MTLVTLGPRMTARNSCKPVKVIEAARQVAAEEELDIDADHITARRLGRLLKKMRFEQARGGAGVRGWNIKNAELGRWAASLELDSGKKAMREAVEASPAAPQGEPKIERSPRRRIQSQPRGLAADARRRLIKLWSAPRDYLGQDLAHTRHMRRSVFIQRQVMKPLAGLRRLRGFDRANPEANITNVINATNVTGPGSPPDSELPFPNSELGTWNSGLPPGTQHSALRSAGRRMHGRGRNRGGAGQHTTRPDNPRDRDRAREFNRQFGGDAPCFAFAETLTFGRFSEN